MWLNFLNDQIRIHHLNTNSYTAKPWECYENHSQGLLVSLVWNFNISLWLQDYIKQLKYLFFLKQFL